MYQIKKLFPRYPSPWVTHTFDGTSSHHWCLSVQSVAGRTQLLAGTEGGAAGGGAMLCSCSQPSSSAMGFANRPAIICSAGSCESPFHAVHYHAQHTVRAQNAA
jgi:hypothetical protein